MFSSTRRFPQNNHNNVVNTWTSDGQHIGYQNYNLCDDIIDTFTFISYVKVLNNNNNETKKKKKNNKTPTDIIYKMESINKFVYKIQNLLE